MNLRKRALVGSPSTEATDREIENRKLVREAAAESFVLLKNENNLLPLEKGTKLGLYGAGAVKTVKGGTGSGDVNERDSVSIYQGLSNAGFEITSKDWLSGYQKTYEKSREDWKQSIIDKSVKENMNVVMAYFATPYHLPAGDPIPDCAKEDGADTAIFVLSRIAGEGTDRRDEELDYYLSKDERAMLDQLSACYKHIILLLNAGGIVDLAFLEEYPKIESVVNVLQPGQEGGNAVADVLCGKKTPSGKLADSWAMDYSDYPSAETFSFKSGDVFHEEYKEGIYVGYRYFDTFDVPVRYGFGFGLSYTTFSIKTQKVTVSNLDSENPVLTAAVEVTNTGVIYSGKEVVQIFVSCPQGSRVKEYRRLAGFAKTKELAPGEKQSLSITFPLYQLTSYEEVTASWVLDGGNYGIWVGNSLSDAKLCAVLSLDQSAVMVSGSNICKKQRELEEITPDQAKLLEKQKAWEAIAKEENLPNLQIKSDQIQTKTISYDADQEAFIGRAKEIVENMTTDQLLLLATGDISMGQGSAIGNAGQSVPGAAAETTSAFAKPPMTNPREMAGYFGFTEDEVNMLCETYQRSFDETQAWYDGYDLVMFYGTVQKTYAMYSPKSVVEAMLSGVYDNYWNQTESYEALKVYIQMNYGGLKEAIVRMLAGDRVQINTGTFSNDMTTFETKDDVLTLLVHLGYLSYHWPDKTVTIPNKEV